MTAVDTCRECGYPEPGMGSTRRLSEQMLARTDTLLTMALGMLETASDDLRTGWHHVVANDIDAAVADLRVQRAIVRERLVSGFDGQED